MREICSYGSARERGGNEPLYSDCAMQVCELGNCIKGYKKQLLATLQVINPAILYDKVWSSIGSESCVVIRDGGTKRRQRLLKECELASKWS